MKRLIVSIGGLLAVMYLSAMPPTTQRTKAPASQHSLAASTSKSESAKARSKSPAERLAQNKVLSNRLSAILEQQNPRVTDMQMASQGFGSLCQFVTAVHISHNLGIPFDQLKTAVLTNGSLGKAIPTIKPNADTKAELWKAAVQSADDLHDSYWAIAQSSSRSM